MTVFTKTAADIFSAQDASGDARKVSNHDVQVWGTEVERALAAFQAGGGVIFQSKAQADANLGYDANTMAWVFDDDPSLAGIYQKQGASGSGSWQRVGDLPYSFILATNTNSGNPNAIEATTPVAIPAADGGALIALPIIADNTASPVTVSFNGETPLTIKTASGSDIVPGGLTQNMIVWGYKQGANFRLATDQASAAIQAAAEDAADRAQSYAAMLSADKVKFSTVAALLADETMSYTPGSGLVEVGEGDIIEAQGFRYEVAASTAADAHVETAGGVKLYEAGPLFTSIDRMARSAGGTWAMVTSGFRAGSFAWSDANLSAEVTADPLEGLYIAPDSDPTGASGAWVRVFDGPVRFEWWGADPTGSTPCSEQIQDAVSTMLELSIEDVDATGAKFNMTGGASDVPLANNEYVGAAVVALKNGGVIRVNGGEFFSTDPSETKNLFAGVLLGEFTFRNVTIDRAYVPNMADDSNHAHGIAAYGVDLFVVHNCKPKNIRGDGVYATRDWISPTPTNKRCGTIDISHNQLIGCKRNYVALTSYVNATVTNNHCVGLPGGLWARSCAIDIEPSQIFEDIGRTVVTGNIVYGFGVERGIRALVAANKIPSDLYEALIISGNTVDSDELDTGIQVDARGKLRQLVVSNNTVKTALTVGIIIAESAKLATVTGNSVECSDGNSGIYWYMSPERPNSPTAICSNNIISKNKSGQFRAINANMSGGAYLTANGNTCFAVDSTLEAIRLTAFTSATKAKTLIANGNSGAGFTGGININNSEKAIAVGNGFAVTGVSNTNEAFANNL